MFDHFNELLKISCAKYKKTIEEKEGMMKKKALIVNQSMQARKTLSHILKEQGFFVEEVQTGEEALAYCDYSLPHCIFLEKDMPEIDGLEFINFFKYNHPKAETKIILCSHDNNGMSIEEVENLGAHFFTNPPFEQANISQALQQLNMI